MTTSRIDDTPSASTQTRAKDPWKPLLYLNLYRVVVAAVFILSFFIKTKGSILGQHSPTLFLFCSILYLFSSIVANLALQFRWASFNTLVHTLTFLDIGVLTILMHASGSIGSGLGMLLVVAIAGSSIITEGRTAILFAAMAAICILAEQFASQLEGELVTNYTQAGFLGVTLFATAILAHVLSSRLHETEALAEQRGIDLANMAQLNEYVIQRLKSGLIVVDQQGFVRMINESAWAYLGHPAAPEQPRVRLATLCKPLAEQLRAWQTGKIPRNSTISVATASVELLPGFTSLGLEQNSGCLIFLEDASRVAQQAQQLKLASLGRLTASIAHEVRNPLGAISHAGQLLAESPHLDEGDRRLTEIIHNNSERVNAIIENVLRLSRRGNALPEEIQLGDWLQSFKAEFVLGHYAAATDIAIHVEPATTTVFMDSTQLHQVMWNLCQNGLRYSQDYPGSPKLNICGGVVKGSQRAFLEIIDHGVGITPEVAANIFEPFFTTEKSGSGLGLYISRELCEANSAHLRYQPVVGGGSCFRIDFPPAVTF